MPVSETKASRFDRPLSGFKRTRGNDGARIPEKSTRIDPLRRWSVSAGDCERGHGRLTHDLNGTARFVYEFQQCACRPGAAIAKTIGYSF